MLSAIFDGLLIGFALAFLLGPVFFLLISTSVNKGFLQAVIIASGVMLSDAMYIAIAHFGFATFASSSEFKYIFGFVGGVILIVFGIVNLIKKPVIKAEEVREIFSSRELVMYGVKGFMLNTFNPFAVIFWLGVASSMGSKNYDSTETFVFYLSILVTVLSTDIFKSFLAKKLQKIINVKFFSVLNKISGIALILFGIQVLYKSFFGE